MEASSSIVSSAKASLPPLQPPRRPPATTPPTLPLPPPPAPPPPLFPGLTPPMQPPSDLATPDGRFFCTRLEVTSSFTPDSSRREPPTYLRNQFGISLLFITDCYYRNSYDVNRPFIGISCLSRENTPNASVEASDRAFYATNHIHPWLERRTLYENKISPRCFHSDFYIAFR